MSRINISSVMKEKANGTSVAWSMTRLTVFLFTFACTVNIAPGMGWPLAFVCACTLFAIPFTKLFEGKDGARLLGKLLDKFGTGEAGFADKGGVVKLVEAFVPHEWADDRKDDGIL